MQLEDHPGDVIRKARKMMDVSAEKAATAAGISLGELEALENSGRLAGKINFPALAKMLGLHSDKLANFAAGWHPAEQKLSRWGGLHLISTRDDEMSVNAFLAWDEATRAAALFDTGMDAQPIIQFLAEKKLTLQHVFITHTHWDHVEGLPKIRAAFPEAAIHSGYEKAPKPQRLAAGEVIALGKLQISYRATPGHADDGTTYLIHGWPGSAPTVAIVGDTILAGSMCNGNGKWELARQKIREEILSWPDETLLCPGHGPVTTVAEEKQHNPFF